MPDGFSLPAVSLMTIGVVHRRRLREVYRSAGWPCQDTIEIELVAAGLLVRERGPFGHETLRVITLLRAKCIANMYCTV